jgi:hypothetical protein
MNEVHGMPEPVFRRFWISMIAGAMLKSGKGFRMDSPRRVPPKGAAKYRGERRSDKPGTSKVSRALLAGVVR